MPQPAERVPRPRVAGRPAPAAGAAPGLLRLRLAALDVGHGQPRLGARPRLQQVRVLAGEQAALPGAGPHDAAGQCRMSELLDNVLMHSATLIVVSSPTEVGILVP